MNKIVRISGRRSGVNLAQAATMQRYVNQMLDDGKEARMRHYGGGLISEVVHSIDPKSGLTWAQETILVEL